MTKIDTLISVVIPTYNPDINRLNQTIEGLKDQSLPVGNWELIIVDNNSSEPLDIQLDWHPLYKIVPETRQGLTWARLKGFKQASGAIIVLVDDDNILNRDYLQNVLDIMESDVHLGAAGGKSLPLFDAPVPSWLREFYGNLALRDLGEEVLLASWEERYPLAAPIGAGMVIRKVALSGYIERTTDINAVIADRTGTSLSSGGDNDIVIEILKSGWKVGYFPTLKLMHIIPAERTKVAYLAKLTNNIQKSWIGVLQKHGINPWPLIPAWTVSLRKIKAWFLYSAFRSKTDYIKWRGACGMFDGLAKRTNEKA